MTAQALRAIVRNPLCGRCARLARVRIVARRAGHPVAARALARALQQRLILRRRASVRPDLALMHEIRHTIEQHLTRPVRRQRMSQPVDRRFALEMALQTHRIAPRRIQLRRIQHRRLTLRPHVLRRIAMARCAADPPCANGAAAKWFRAPGSAAATPLTWQCRQFASTGRVSGISRAFRKFGAMSHTRFFAYQFTGASNQ